MNKKVIAALSIGIFSAIFVGVTHLLNYLNKGIWFDIGTGVFLIFIWVVVLNYIFKKYKIAGYDDNDKFKVEFYAIADVADHVLKYAVIMTKYNNNWVFARHEARDTWEIPGGRREPNEEIIKTAERELIEETGAKIFELEPVCVYSVTSDIEKSYGLLCYAEIIEFGNPLCMEICEIKEFESMPSHLTYPLIQPELFKKIITYLE
jgi:8-oxo-dGTP diphosphatase